MTLTILFDLDDTLLSNNMDLFIPAYLQALSKSFDGIHPLKTIQGVLEATRDMQTNQDPTLTLETVFDQKFYPGVGISKIHLLDKINHFYAEEFGKLRSLTSPRPDALKVVKYALQRGHKIVIATNPLFPQAATFQRMDWAGLTPFKNQIALVSTYEYFHFSKPNIEYIAEILAQLGWQIQPCVMIGNSYEDDIAPAVKFGLPVFWLNNNKNDGQNKSTQCPQGEIKDVIPWLEIIENKKVPDTYSGWNSSLAILNSTPAALHTYLVKNNHHINPAESANHNHSLGRIINYLRFIEFEINRHMLETTLDGKLNQIKYPELNETSFDKNNPETNILSSWGEFAGERIKNINLIKNFSQQDQLQVLPALEKIGELDRKMVQLAYKAIY